MKIKLTPEQQTELLELSELPGQTPLDICTVMQFNYADFVVDLSNPLSDVHKVYHTGKAKLSIGFEKKLMQLANQGSGPAQTLANKIMKDSNIRKMREYYG